MDDSRYSLYVALMLSTVLIAAPLRAAKSDWSGLKTLKPNVKVRIVLNDSKTYEGPLRRVNEEGITVQQAAGEQTFARKDILRVYLRGDNHRGRNLAIGAGFGAIVAGLALIGNNVIARYPGFGNGWPFPAGIGLGAGIGLAIPTGGWHLVYRARGHGQTPCAADTLARVDLPAPPGGPVGPVTQVSVSLDGKVLRVARTP